jgi:hypothetical protein
MTEFVADGEESDARWKMLQGRRGARGWRVFNMLDQVKLHGLATPLRIFAPAHRQRNAQ